MISHHIDPAGLVTTFETSAGELAIVRREIVVDRPEIVGYAAGESHFEIVEAVFVAADDADFALLVLVGANPAESVAGVLAARGIGFRPASHANGHGTAQPSEAVVPDTTRLAPRRVEQHRLCRRPATAGSGPR